MNKTTWGIKAIINMQPIIANMKGRMAFDRLIMPIPEIAHPTKRFVPTGGVRNPTHKLTSMNKPKCTGLSPYPTAIGTIIGVKIRIMAVASTNVPKIRKTTSIINRKDT